jgi:predicted RNA-binding Zn ribbon-like protein
MTGVPAKDGPMPANHDAVELIRSFTNTIDVESGTDQLETATTFLAWLVEQGLVDGSARVTQADLALALRLRSAIRAALAVHHERTDDPAGRSDLRDVIAELPLRLDPTADGGFELVPIDRGVRGAIAGFAAAIGRAAGVGDWERLKLCPADDCAWAFLDESKNRSRRWCSMEVCGNRSKTRSYRERTTVPD